MRTYQEGLQLLQHHKYERARSLFLKLADGGAHPLADRARLYVNTCNQRLQQAANSFRSVEEQYDYAVSLINGGNHGGARDLLDKILKQAPKADYAWYAKAVVECQTGRYEDSLRALTESIRLNATIRFQARNDSDFANLADDPRFTELLYPETELSPGGAQE
jgi:tetratricopeptide (TPR) repeat protein